MQFTINSTDLTKILSQMMKVVPAKPILNILSCLLIKIKDGVMEVTATNEENTSTFVTDCLDSQDGETAIEAKFLHALLKTLPDTPVTFKSDASTMKISWGTGSADVPTQDARDFPALKKCEGDKLIISASELKNAIALAASCAEVNELHPTLGGVCLDFDEHMLNIVGTDSHKLIITGVVISGNTCKATYILPLNAVAALRELADNTDGDIVATSDGRNIRFSTIGQTLTCRLMEGKYPAYESVIPKDSSSDVTVDRDLLTGALKRISVCAGSGKPLVTLTVSGSGITVQAKDLANGLSGSETVSHKGLGGDDIEISFNAGILTGLLAGFPDKEVSLRFNGPAKAALLYPTNQDINTRALIMPTR